MAAEPFGWIVFFEFAGQGLCISPPRPLFRADTQIAPNLDHSPWGPGSEPLNAILPPVSTPSPSLEEVVALLKHMFGAGLR